jgi:hypothetical protein
MSKKICLKPRINKLNGQINFSLKKNSLPKKVKQKLPELKGIKLDLDSFEW